MIQLHVGFGSWILTKYIFCTIIIHRYAILIAYAMKYIPAIDMIGKCDQCGLENVEITMVKSDQKKELHLCNQCKPTDGAYGY